MKVQVHLKSIEMGRKERRERHVEDCAWQILGNRPALVAINVTSERD